ncbi:MAG TPA: hypothetical protein VKE73_04940, partial [Myxococcota bacterium]|nr:hypothetical protein [Myxococcota bacterium]
MRCTSTAAFGAVDRSHFGIEPGNRSSHRETPTNLLAWRAPRAVGPSATMQFHVLSFEGPDGYSRAGGIASRIEGLAQGLAGLGFETHLWFVGDPALPGHESHGTLHLHRWCQWI